MKKDVRLQLYITDKMDSSLKELSSIMGMNKNEIIRVAIAQYVAGWDKSIELIKGYADELIKSEK